MREAAAGRDPGAWGVDPRIAQLAANADVRLVHDPHQRGRVARARRVGVFEAVSLSAGQERAADRYQSDWNERVGVQTHEAGPTPVVDSSPGLAPGQHVTQRMIDAGKRVEEAHAEAGRAAAILMAELVEPLVRRGIARRWRAVVEAVTGETERHAQAARVRAACEALAMAYEAIDKRKAEAARARRFAGGGPSA